MFLFGLSQNNCLLLKINIYIFYQNTPHYQLTYQFNDEVKCNKRVRFSFYLIKLVVINVSLIRVFFCPWTIILERRLEIRFSRRAPQSCTNWRDTNKVRSVTGLRLPKGFRIGIHVIPRWNMYQNQKGQKQELVAFDHRIIGTIGHATTLQTVCITWML